MPALDTFARNRNHDLLSSLKSVMDVSSKQEIETGSFAPWGLTLWSPSSIRVVDWNIDRGLQLSGIVEFLADAKADLIILQEVDINARRTHRLNVAREIAQKLQMNYVFGREFQELTQGSRTSPAYHGQATLSPWPLSNPRILRFQRQSNFWRPRWYLPDIAAFSGEDRRTDSPGDRSKRCWEISGQLQPSPGEPRR